MSRDSHRQIHRLDDVWVDYLRYFCSQDCLYVHSDNMAAALSFSEAKYYGPSLADSRKLAKNMLSVMPERAVSFYLFSRHAKLTPDAHHIVAGVSSPARRSRKILQHFFIDVNDPRNGIFLPADENSLYLGAIHGRHTREYDEYVNRCISKARTRTQVFEILDDIKDSLYTGGRNLLKKTRLTSNATNLNRFLLPPPRDVDNNR